MNVCAYFGCEKPASRSSKNLCEAHYRKALREGRRVLVPLNEEQRNIIIAAYEAGQSSYKIGKALGMREDKIQWWLRKWRVKMRPVGFQKGQRSPRFKGRKQDRYGYIQIYKPDHPNADSKGYVREHRLVAAESLGRPLSRDEIAHHDDETKDNNTSTNIIVMTNGEHTKLHNPRLGTGRGVIKCPGCDRTISHYARGLCRRCWGREEGKKLRDRNHDNGANNA